MAEKLFSYADKQVMDEVGSSGGDSGGSSGGGYSPLIIHPNVGEGSIVFDKTWKEVHDHFISGGIAFIVYPDEPGESLGEVDMVISAGCYLNADASEKYQIATRSNIYSTSTENGYPHD